MLSLPAELLRIVVQSVTPNDLITLASLNRHLRHAVIGCIDYDLAKLHITVAAGVDPADPPFEVPEHLHRIHFDHRLLFEHAVAAVSLFHISEFNLEAIWGNPWRSEWADKEGRPRVEACRPHRARVLQAAVNKRISMLPDTSSVPFVLDLNEAEIEDVAHMAGIVMSLDLLNDLRNAFPNQVNDRSHPESTSFQSFLFACAEIGFRNGLSLICNNKHPLFRRHRKYLLQVAIDFDQVTIVELLLDNGVSANSILGEFEPKRAIFYALEDSGAEVLRLLLQRGANPNEVFESKAALHRVAQWGHLQALKVLLEFGADTEVLDSEQATPLHYAVQGLQVECLAALLEACANVDAVDEQGRTALSMACAEGLRDIVRTLLDHGAEVNAPETQCSPLHEVLECDNTVPEVSDVVEMLLEAGARKDLRNGTGETPLHFAVKNGHAASVALLLESGAGNVDRDGRRSTFRRLV
ncbi:hypothetical protein HDU96_005861 [Phlyctochytrium bullatum]|nr:hypothetical protein HDU96_005861 [Phlyctochytrium bullatum]